MFCYAQLFLSRLVTVSDGAYGFWDQSLIDQASICEDSLTLSITCFIRFCIGFRVSGFRVGSRHGPGLQTLGSSLDVF